MQEISENKRMANCHSFFYIFKTDDTFALMKGENNV
jgi:hypothetical protein